MNQKITKIALAGALTTISTGTIVTNLAPTAYAAPSAQTNTTVATYTVINTQLLNVRNGAGINYKAVATVKKGTTLNGIVNNGWLRITSDPYVNKYVSASPSYLKKIVIATKPVTPTPTKPTAPTTPTPIVVVNAKNYSVNTSTLNVRSGAGTNYSLFSTISQGTQLTGTIDNGWLKITSGIYSGKYVSAAYVTEVANATNINVDNSQTALREQIITLAASQAGTPYLWGGNAPGVGLDCSGLTSWVYKQVGITLPRTSNAQSNFATPVTADQAKPGDLVFLYDSTGTTYHVGILLDPIAKTYWEAPHPGDVVKIGSFAYTTNYKFGTVIQ